MCGGFASLDGFSSPPILEQVDRRAHSKVFETILFSGNTRS